MTGASLYNMHEWLSGGAPPCQGGGRGFDPRLALLNTKIDIHSDIYFFVFETHPCLKVQSSTLRSGPCNTEGLRSTSVGAGQTSPGRLAPQDLVHRLLLFSSFEHLSIFVLHPSLLHFVMIQTENNR